jgi:Tfp pilus assembly protein PilE
MGQQQLLLIVLGVIIVGIAVVVGINLFTANSVQANQDGVASDVTNIAALAQQYYLKPGSLGGGGNTFTGFTIPANLASTANGTYTVVVAAQTATITGVGTVKDTNSKVAKVVVIVTPNAIGNATITRQ